MTKPKVSIITRTRDRELFLARAMASVLGQTDAPMWEWIVVNDAGDRKAVEEVLAPALSRYPGQVAIVHIEASEGMEHASNTGLAKASGEFVVIHDDDDSWEPEFLNEMVAWLDAPEHALFAGVACHSRRVEETVSGNGILTTRETPFNVWLEELDPWTVLEENPFPPISFLFRRSVYDEAGPFDVSLPVLGDWAFNVRLVLRWPLGVLPKMLANYHHRPRSAKGSSANSITAGHETHRHWEAVLRERWKKEPPLPGLPAFGQLASIAGKIKASRDRLDRLLSLPIRPGPQV
jgi:glycosyltransferase involved in cell wall biosynthesis